MYEIKRADKIEEQIKLGDKVLTVRLDPDAIALEFNKRTNAVIAAEQAIKKYGKSDDVESALQAYTDALINLLSLVFGEDNTVAILEYFENNYIEMGIQIFPFIIEVVTPKIQTAVKAQREQLAGKYASLNRAARRAR
ncbi:MAG: hypothetical protein ACERKO_11530, partial [Acetanaerobacterium sp.]